jgi:heat shock protein HtpX
MLCSGRPAWERIPVGIVVRRMYKQKLKAQGLGRLSPSCVQNRLCAHFGLLETLLTEGLWLVGESVRQLAQKARIGMPEVAILEGEPNAFATGAFRNSALVAVSTGLLQSMNKEEIEAVLGHEITHVSNGDMVTLTLIQGVVNTFVILFARVVGYFVDKTFFRSERGVGPGFYVTVVACEIVFGILASVIVAYFSRLREFRADAGSAQLLASPRPMINALARLNGLQPGELPQSFKAFGITDKPGWLGLFATHPPIEKRIAALQSRG